MKKNNKHHHLPLETWQADQWQLPIQTKPITSRKAVHTIKLSRLFIRSKEPGLRMSAAVSRSSSQRRHKLPRLLRKLMNRQMASAGGIQ